MSIKKIGVQNFQKHTELELDLHPGVNVICGASDKGKSSVIRAIRWLTENRPNGFGFRRDPKIEGRKHSLPKDFITESYIVFEDSEISRQRDAKSINDYVITLQEERIFSALKGDVPREIEEITDIADYCIQSQFDPHFLLSLSPGEVARKISDATGLSKLDHALKYCNSIISNATSSVKASKQKIEDREKEIDQLDYADVILPIIERIEEKESRFGLLMDSLDVLHDMASQLIVRQRRLESLKELLEFEEWAEEILQQVRILNNQKREAFQLQTLIDSLEGLYKKTENILKKQSYEKQIHAILGGIEDLIHYDQEIEELEEFISDIERENRKKQRVLIEIEETKEKYSTILIDNKQCPICGSLITKKHIKEHLEKI